MANTRDKKNNSKKYPNLNNEIVDVLEKSDRKMRYHEYDLKVGKFMINNANRTVTYIPSREVSYELLLNENHQFADNSVNIEEMVIKAAMIKRLHLCIKLLSREEQELIGELFFKGRSERNLSGEWGIPRMTLHDRKEKILLKLRKLLDK